MDNEQRERLLALLGQKSESLFKEYRIKHEGHECTEHIVTVLDGNTIESFVVTQVCVTCKEVTGVIDLSVDTLSDFSKYMFDALKKYQVN